MGSVWKDTFLRLICSIQLGTFVKELKLMQHFKKVLETSEHKKVII